jgi:Putative ParB-like nuclease
MTLSIRGGAFCLPRNRQNCLRTIRRELRPGRGRNDLAGVGICLPPLPILTAVVPREITLGLFVALVATTPHVARRPGCDIVSEYRVRPLLARYFGRRFVDNTGVRLVEAKLNELRPTQMTVGYDEVAFKRRNWNVLTSEERSRFVCEHIFPAVLGSNGNYYILDGHHLGRALLEEGGDNVLILPVEDLSYLDQGGFWRVMERRNLIYPYAQGQRHNFEDMPQLDFGQFMRRGRAHSSCGPRYGVEFR